jgi:glycosyltransferase involved in cell wall biosynthesis
MSKSSCFVSVVAVVRNDSAIERFVERTINVLAENYADYELVLVDDGSLDDTPRRIQRLLDTQEGLRLIRLSREFGNDVAIAAGLDTVIGDYAVVMLAACDPPEAIPDMVRLADEGTDIVIGTCARRPRETWQMRCGRRLFFRLCNRVMQSRLPEDVASMRVLNRVALTALTKIRQKTLYHRLISCTVGFRIRCFEYEQNAPSGPVQPRRMHHAVREAVSILIANSPFPLRVVSYLGVLAAALNLLYMSYVVVINLVKRQVAEGWTTLSLQMAVMFLFLFSTLVVIAEYLAKTMEESKDRPLYHVAEERSSATTQLDLAKRNVHFQPVVRQTDRDAA